MRFLLLPIALALASCATKPTLSSIVPTPPPKAVAVAPEASKLRDQIAEADRVAVSIDTTAKEASKAATAARQQAEKLKAQKTATEAELTQLWESMQFVEARNLFLEAESSKLSTRLNDALRAAATLQQSAAAKDAESEQLRAQHAQLTSAVQNYATQLTTANKAAEKERTRADKLIGEIRLYRIVSIVLALILVGWIAIKLFLPPRIL